MTKEVFLAKQRYYQKQYGITCEDEYDLSIIEACDKAQKERHEITEYCTAVLSALRDLPDELPWCFEQVLTELSHMDANSFQMQSAMIRQNLMILQRIETLTDRMESLDKKVTYILDNLPRR